MAHGGAASFTLESFKAEYNFPHTKESLRRSLHKFDEIGLWRVISPGPGLGHNVWHVEVGAAWRLNSTGARLELNQAWLQKCIEKAKGEPTSHDDVATDRDMDKEEEAEDPESIDRELHLIVRSEVEDALARPLESSAHEQDGWSTGAPLLPDDPIGALEMFARQLSDADSTTFEALRSEVGGRVGAKELRELLEEIYARRDKPDRRIRSETGYARAELRRRSRVSARIEAHR